MQLRSKEEESNNSLIWASMGEQLTLNSSSSSSKTSLRVALTISNRRITLHSRIPNNESGLISSGATMKHFDKRHRNFKLIN